MSHRLGNLIPDFVTFNCTWSCRVLPRQFAADNLKLQCSKSIILSQILIVKRLAIILRLYVIINNREIGTQSACHNNMSCNQRLLEFVCDVRNVGGTNERSFVLLYYINVPKVLLVSIVGYKRGTYLHSSRASESKGSRNVSHHELLSLDHRCVHMPITSRHFSY